ncbi:hypothetical protein Bca52824_060262 [Brassica carinata]|uniref:Exostosin GT47 domain-containing protein n=1 Tax=Brassica carinata TaxID=52824 RepID=A0A8X7QXJ1_BRACI|nr:hypothetical protein Bca52824_060262 [Brassica carinata]
MRRRAAEVPPTEPTEKGNGKSHTNRICLLVSLSLFFWALLLYFHFVVIGSSTNIENQIHLQPQPQPQPSSSSSTSLRIHKFDPPKEKDPLAKPILPPAPVATTSTFNPSETVEFPFVRALKTVDNKSDPCGGKYIYVHDLPSRFNEDMLRDCKKLSLWTNMCKFTTNAGLGPPLENVEGVFSDEGWYATNQFAVDVIFSNRMKQYKCLTNDSSLAAAIFVPFYAGFDVARYLWGCQEHVYARGRVQPWNANDFGIPYPTYFHPAKDSEVFEWQERMRNLDRKWLFSFAGAPARQPQIHQRADHRPVQKLKRREALGVRLRGEQVSLPEQHYANVSRLSLLSSAPGRLLHSQIGFRLHARRLHTRLLPPGLGLHSVHVASAQELLDLLGVHPRGRYSKRNMSIEAAPSDTSRAGQDHEENVISLIPG